MWVEAENITDATGWGVDARFATGFNGQGFLADDAQPKEMTAHYRIDIPQPGSYDIWVRSYRRRIDGGPITLSVGDLHLPVAPADPAQLDRWRWERLGRYDLRAGTQQFTLNRQYEAPGFFQIFIDSIVLSGEPGFDPSRQTEWDPMLDTGWIQSTDMHLDIADSLESGTYRWRVTVRDGDKHIDADGHPGRPSDYRTFRVANQP